MKVSLLVPVYGVEQYVARCAESLFGQTYNDLEYVFVDDCTPDNSIGVIKSVLERFPERRDSVKIIRHEVNRGLGAARATALAASTGDCVMHVDSDDYMPVGAVEALCRRMEETGADVVDGAYERVADGKTVETCMPYHGRTDRYVCMLLCQNIFSNRIWGRLYRRERYKRCGVEHIEGIDYGEDYSVVPGLLYKSDRAWTDEVVYCYRADNASSYTHAMSDKNYSSYVNAVHTTYDMILNYDDYTGHYRTAVEIGVMNLWRYLRSSGRGYKLMEEVFNYEPYGVMAWICYHLIRSRCPLKLADKAYRMWRTMFIKFIYVYGKEKPDTRQTSHTW
ncbi:glycosyltransferase family 2 protein [Xylanibacter caecicola]|uniref:glycosyltransferase family 2 protein n=1 Tax=Xylanibacter caecicola TaxID=2736294 RepID=UPI002590C0F5|nr:glycosyltransferase family 2 protein [Xylanibacter caecicola]